MLEPIAPERFFLDRIMRRYDLDFVIMGGSIEEMGEYGPEKLRDATGPELRMWERMIPPDIQEMVRKVYYGTDLTLEATPEEVRGAIEYQRVVYLNAKDFAVLRSHPPEGFDHNTDRDRLLAGHFATVGDTRVFVSREIPQGYHLKMEEPDPRLNWRPASDGPRQLYPKPEPYDYRLEPLLTPHGY